MANLHVIAIVLCLLLFFPVQATITTSLNAVCDENGQTRIVETSPKGSIDIATTGAMGYSGTKMIKKDNTEGTLTLDAEDGSMRLRTPEYANRISGKSLNASAIYGFIISPVEVAVTDPQDNSTTILTAMTKIGRSAIAIDASVLSDAKVTERINVPYKGRPLTIAEMDQFGGALLFNRTLELDGNDIWNGDKL